MRALKVVREAGVRRVIAQGGLEPVSRRPPLRDEPANRYPVTRDDNGLAMLDCIEDVGEVPCRLRGSYRDHEYILSDLVCLCVYSSSRRGSQRTSPGLGRAHPAASSATLHDDPERMRLTRLAPIPRSGSPPLPVQRCGRGYGRAGTVPGRYPALAASGWRGGVEHELVRDDLSRGPAQTRTSRGAASQPAG